MNSALAKLVVTGGCPLQRAALSDWLLAHGFRIAGATSAPNDDQPDLALFLCSEHDPAAELATGDDSHQCCQTIAILSCNCERALATALARGLPNVFCADEPADRLATAIDAVLSGQGYQSPTFLQYSSRATNVASMPRTVLTHREHDVLRLLAQGFSKKRIAECLHLSVKTVDNHSTSIMSKLNIHNRVDLARYAIREGLATA